MAKALEVVRREALHALPPTLFFLVSFNILVLTVALLTRGGGAPAVDHAAASFAALICGKAVLVADSLPFLNRYPDKPLIWNTVWKAALYMLVTLAFRLLERLVSAATSEAGFAATLGDAAAHFDWPRFWAVQLWLAILFLGYSGFREMVGVVGRARMVAVFFGPPAGATRR